MRKQGIWGYAFTLPFLIHIIGLMIFPVVFSAYLTFTKYDLFNSPQWVGFTNWVRLTKEPVFWSSLRNVVFFALVYVPVQAAAALAVAYLLNLSIRGKTLFRLFYFLPVVTPWMAAGVLWGWMYNKQYGLVNGLLGEIRIGPVGWLESKHWWITIGAMAVVNVWKGVGQAIILILAGMQNISKEMQEAARIDGASGWNFFRSIVMPLVSPMLYLVMVLSTISAFHAFDVFLAIQGSNVVSVDENKLVTNMLIYRDAFMLANFGKASTTAWALFIVVLVITLFQKRLEKRWVHYG